MKIKGIDVSYCQKGLDYNKVKDAGVKFAIIRVGAKLRKDTEADYHVRGCKDNSIDYGFYWYSYAYSVDEAADEARKCLEVISQYDKPVYPVFFDMEENSQAKLGKKLCTDMALRFCEIIEKGGFRCGIYANPSWLESYYDKARIVGKYDIWLAHWTNNPDIPSRYDYGQTMWQWGMDRIGGVDAAPDARVDGDICFTEYAKSVPAKKSVAEIAREVILGKWGNGAERKMRLTNAGYDYSAVQKKVNEMLK